MEDIKIGGMTADEWEAAANPPQTTDEDLTNLGIIQQPTETEEKAPTDKDIPSKVERTDYENLGYWQTVGDELMAAGVEATRFFLPKDKELKYTPRTKAGEAYQTFSKYLFGVGGLMLGGEAAGIAKGALLAKNIATGTKALGAAETILKGDKFFKTGKGGLKALGVKLLNIGTQGVAQGAILDTTIHNAEEGRMVDIFGDTNNKFIDWLQSDEDESVLENKLKNVIDGALFSIGINGVFSAASPILGRLFKNTKKVKKGIATEETVQEIVQDQAKLGKIADTADLFDNVDDILKEAQETGADPYQMIIDRFHPDDIERANKALEFKLNGEEPFIHDDGTFDIKISKWEDAYKVSEEEYKKQLAAQDLANGSEFSGDTALSHQDEAIKETWTNRGWIGEYEELNKTSANKIATNYKDKWKIDNNIKVEFVDGLTIKGKPVEGNTSATQFLGKNKKATKASQTKIDKKQQEIKRLEDKITMIEGGNAPVNDELDLLKEDLRIKYNELKDLQNIPQPQKLSNITIQIDKNAKNPYATLRTELEHARDIAKGEVPKNAEVEGSGVHFARYKGDNEAEIAAGYTYKKSVGRNKALNPEASENVVKDGQIAESELKYNQEVKSNGKQPRQTNEQQAEAIRRFVEGASKYNNSGSYENGLFIRRNNLWVVNDSKGSLFDEANISKSNYQELPQTTEAGQTFADALTKAKKNLGAKGEYVDVHTAEEYANAKTFLSEDGLSGVAVTKDGEIISVFVDPTAKVAEGRGRGHALIELGKQNGGTKLNCYDVGLPEYYNNHGFTETNRTKWNDKFWDKEKWHKELHTKYNKGEPDIVDMELIKNDTPPVNPQQTQAEQLKLDFNSAVSATKSTDELVDNVASGAVKVNDVEDVGTILNKTIELDTEISGTTWEAIAKDADKKADLMLQAEELGLYDELTQALSLNDVKTMDDITRKVLAAQKLGSQLADKLAILGKNPPIEQMQPIIDMIDVIGRYTKETGSASGRSLQARKFINKAIQTFGSLRLSELTKEGISTVSDLLSVEINKLFDLNFTRGEKLTPQELKQALVEGLLKNTDAPLTQLITGDAQLSKKFNDILDGIFQEGKKLSPQEVAAKIEVAVTEARYREAFNATKLAETPETKAEVIKNWCDAQGGMTSFFVHNLLSNIGTLAKNVISGVTNGLYFPAKKMLAGYLGGGESMVKEGWNTYLNMMSSCQEAWSLCKQAFLEGEGTLSMMKDTMALAEGETFNGFREWKFDFTTKEGIWQACQNFHSVMTRAMGASDEFMSQLNYRAIMRAKALGEAEDLAKLYNITDEAIKADLAEDIFQKAFDNAGKPTNVDALAEAKDILYQLPLNGQVFDRAAGEMKQVRPETVATMVGKGINELAAKNSLFKIFFPFVKTGTNILQQNLDHNLFYMLSSAKRDLLLAKTQEGALARSQVAFGMFSFFTASGLALSGKITGSAPPDKKERAALFETGWKPYSIRVGDKYVSYQGYEPMQTILGFAADSVNIFSNITNSEDEAKWEKFSQQIMATAVNNFLDKAAFRTGLRQLSFITSPDENAEELVKALAQTAQGFLPDSAMVRGISSFGNRSVTSPSSYERLFNNYFNRGLGDYRRDVFGNRQDNYGLLVTNVAPDNANLPEYAELENLAHFGFSPSDISKVIKDTTLKYTEFKDPNTGRSVYDTMQEELSTIELDGKTLQEAVRDLVTSQEYQDLPIGVNMNGYKFSKSEPTKLNAIRSIFVEYNNAALNNVIKEYGDLYLDNKGRTMSEAVEEVQNEKLNQSINEGLQHNIGNQIKQFGY